MIDETDWYLVDEVKGGNDAAFDAIMHKYKRQIISFVYRMTGNAIEAEDAAQDVFVRAYRSIISQRFKNTGSSFSAWLFQIARNSAIDRIRSLKRHPDRYKGLPDDLTNIAAGRTASEAAVAGETGRQIAEAVASLPEDQRTVVILAEYEGLSHSEIAEIMRCSEKSVESRLYRARQFLRKMLKDLLP